MDLYDDIYIDGQWVRQALQGNQKGFDRLVKQYQTALLGLTYHWTRDPAEAQDLTQEIFVQAYENLKQLKQAEKFASWLRSIATNRCRMWKRTQHQNPSESLDTPTNRQTLYAIAHPDKLPSEQIEDREKLAAIDSVLGKLSNTLHLTARLFYINGLSYREISVFLDVPITTVESRLHKVRIQLRQTALRKSLESILDLTPTRKENTRMDPILIKIGGDLIASCEAPEDPEHDLLIQISKVREELAAEHQFNLPPVRICDDNQFQPRAYEIFLFEKPVAKGDLDTEETVRTISTHLRETVRSNQSKF